MHWPWAADESFFIMCAYIQNHHFILQSLPGGNPQGTYEEANKEENKEKNRYPNILPCEYTFCSVFWVTPTSSQLPVPCVTCFKYSCFPCYSRFFRRVCVCICNEVVSSQFFFTCSFCCIFTMHHDLGFFKLLFTLNKWFEFHGNMFICFLG